MRSQQTKGNGAVLLCEEVTAGVMTSAETHK